MKKRVLALALCASLALTGCTAMLEREYVSVAPHPQVPDTEEDSDAIWVESYPELVNAILFQVRLHQEERTIRLRSYTGDVEADLDRACQEVSTDDPLGAYAVESIEADFERIVLYYEATVDITYRRTREQMDAVSTVTGSGAIRAKLQDALAGFVPEAAMRINYFPDDADADYIHGLLLQAYYDTPEAALGLPETAVDLYPETGLQRIVELRFTYPEGAAALKRKSAALIADADELVLPIQAQTGMGDDLLRGLYDALLARLAGGEGEEDAPAPGSTAYAALVEGRADSQGAALAYKLLCDRAGVECSVVRGTRSGEPYYWNIVAAQGGFRHLDAGREDAFLLTDGAFQALTGAEWERADYPVCGEMEE